MAPGILYCSVESQRGVPCTEGQGFTLIELAITLAILGILITLALPSWSEWIQNSQIRSATDSLVSGLNLARSEAVRRNTLVRFSLVSSISASCTLSSTSGNWVVSRGSPVGACNVAPADPADLAVATVADPKIVQVRPNAESTRSATVSAFLNANPANTTTANQVVFDGLGRVASATSGTAIQRIEVASSASGTYRNLRIVITPSGLVRSCEPSLPSTTSSTDPRKC